MKNRLIDLNQDLITIQKLIYNKVGLVCTNINHEIEGVEYGACTFNLNNKLIKFRVGKITPTKVGQFVTLWKRIDNGPILPYDLSDPIDLFVISVRQGVNHFGQFAFPKLLLHQKSIVSKDGKGGKRAIRIYPPWDKPENAQAKKTQAWQLEYFLGIDPDKRIDLALIKKLYQEKD